MSKLLQNLSQSQIVAKMFLKILHNVVLNHCKIVKKISGGHCKTVAKTNAISTFCISAISSISSIKQIAGRNGTHVGFLHGEDGVHQDMVVVRFNELPLPVICLRKDPKELLETKKLQSIEAKIHSRVRCVCTFMSLSKVGMTVALGN